MVTLLFYFQRDYDGPDRGRILSAGHPFWSEYVLPAGTEREEHIHIIINSVQEADNVIQT